MEDTYVTSKRLESDYPTKLILANQSLPKFLNFR